MVTAVIVPKEQTGAGVVTVVENTGVIAEVVRSLGSDLQTRLKCPFSPQLLQTAFSGGHLIRDVCRTRRSNTWN